MLPRSSDRRMDAGGFTLLELVVVLGIIGIILMAAMPRYLASRRQAFVAEADHALAELKHLGWAHHIRYATWSGLTDGNMASTLGFYPPGSGSGCWDYGLANDATPAEIRFEARGRSSPVKCLPTNGTTVTLTLDANGSSSRAVSYP